MAEIAELIFEANTTELIKADAALDRLNKTGVRTDSVVRRMTGSFRIQKGAAQQAAFQVQDFAVQVASGTSAVRAFSQQAPQLLGVFGAGGAILGTLVAVSSAIAGPFVESLFDAETATDQLGAALKALNGIIDETDSGTKTLTDTFAELAERNSVVAQAALQEALLKTEDALKAANDEALELAKSLSPSELGGRFDRLNLLVLTARRQLSAGAIDVQEFNNRINKLFLETGEADPSKAFREAREEIARLAEESRKIEERRQTLLGGTDQLGGKSQVEEQEKAIEKAQELADRQADIRARQLAKEENDRVIALQNRIFQIEDSLRTETQKIEDFYNERKGVIQQALDDELLIKQEAAALEQALEEQKQSKLNEIADREQAKRKQAMMATLSAYGQLFGNLTALMSSESQEAFKIGQKAAIASAIVNGIESTISSYAFGSEIGGPVVGALFAATAAAATGAMVAQIKSAKPPGRAQGGQVRPGQAYTVGEFGPETLVMGSNGGSVIPKVAANDAVNLQVYNNVKVMGGDAKVTTNTSQVGDRKFVTDIVVDLMGNQSSPARNALHATSNTRPIGGR